MVQVSYLLGRNEPIMRIDIDNNLALRRRAEEIVSKFSRVDLENGNIEEFLAEVARTP